MQDQNIIIFLDKIKKLIELGAYPKAIIELDATMEILEKHTREKKGKLFQEMEMQYSGSAEDLRLKMNEFLRWANSRFS